MNSLVQTTTWWQVLLWAGGFAFVPYMVAMAMDFPFLSLEQSLYNFIGLALVVIINVEILLPRLYFQQKNLAFLVCGVTLVMLLATVVYWNGPRWEPPMVSSMRTEMRPFVKKMGRFGGYFRMVGRVMPFFMALVGSSVVSIGAFARRKEKRAIELEKEKLETEMKFLKSQINPHFLFNALNNIYTLTLTQSKSAPEHLLRLSDMLRYMLYECKADRVPLSAEINYLQNYIQMKKLKDSGGMNIEVHLPAQTPDLQIAPLLFIPFVENAFKHSKIEDLEKGWIKIKLRTVERELRFCVSNSIPAQNFTKDQVGGIGLDNVQRQLQLMYPGQYSLDIEKKESLFAVQLRIQL
ncbi:MAG: histidine kinase [Saprospiraceae bacterium]|nr:histidine kinase [Saprospiraceae bacterium]